jgi:hypothetical protein
MLFEKYTALNDLFDYEQISDKEWKPVRPREFSWATLYGVDITGCNVRNRRKNNSTSTTPCVQEELSDINRWNSGYWAAVLISPRHAVVCNHYYVVVPGQENNLVFWGRSGTEYRPKVKSSVDLTGDRRILEFEEDLPADDVKIYKIVDARWIPEGTKLWIYDNQGRMLYKVHETLKGWKYPAFNFQQVWHPDPVLGNICGVHSGDSGSPVLMTDPVTNETYFVGNYAGGYPYYEDRSIEVALKALDEQIQFVKPSLSRGDINRDGVVDGADIAQILANYGQHGYVQGDVNWDGKIDGEDIGALLADWGECKPNFIAYEDWYFGNTGGNNGDPDTKNGAGVTVITNGNATAFRKGN